MRLFFTHLACLFFLFVVPATAQKFVWAKQLKPLNAQITNSVVDNEGNTCITGFLGNKAVFDTGSNGTVFNNSTPDFNGFVAQGASFLAKYDAAGNFMHAITIYGNANADSYGYITAMCTDNTGRIFAIGDYWGHMVFGNHTLVSDSFATSHFILQCNSDGYISWIKPLNNTSEISFGFTTISIACDNNGHLYLSGYSDTFLPYVLDGFDLSNASTFLAKIDENSGTAQWVRQFTGYNIGAVKTDNENNVIVAGSFGQTMAVLSETDTLHNVSTNVNNVSNFLAKFDQAGNFIWSVQADTIGGVGAVVPLDIAVDANNSIYTVGNRHYTKYTKYGIQVWDHSTNGGYNICYGSGGNYILNPTLDSFVFDGTTIPTPAYQPVLLKTDTLTGNIVWKTQPLKVTSSPIGSGSSFAIAHNIAAGLHGAVQLVGYGDTLMQLGAAHFLSAGAFVSLIDDTDYAPAANNVIKGNIFSDANQNCSNDAEPAIAGFGVMAQSGPYYTVADSLGNYTLKVDAGTYVVQEIIPYNHDATYTQDCFSSITVPMQGAGLMATGKDFPNRQHNCALLQLSTRIANPYSYLDSGIYHEQMNYSQNTIQDSVFICNYGNDTAHNVVFTKHYPGSLMSPVSSSIPWTSYSAADSLMLFSLGDILPGSCIGIEITDTLDYTPQLLFPGSTDYVWNDTLYPFYYQVTPLNSCFSSDSVYNHFTTIAQYVYPNHVGVPIVTAPQNNIKIYPNPTNSSFTIAGLKSGSSIDVFSIVGQRVFSSNNSVGETMVMSLTDQPAGMYCVIIRNGGSVITRKILKQ